LNILITGGAGGIGSTLALHLTELGHNITALDNLHNGYFDNLMENGKQICKFVCSDIRDTDSLISILKQNEIEYVVHLAAITSLPECEEYPSYCLDINVSGTASVLTASRMVGIKRTIVASTSAIYEKNTKNEAPFEESLAVNPKLFYPLSKKLMEDVVKSYVQNYDMDIVTLRFFNVFGPRQDIHRKTPPLINYIVRGIKNGEKLTFYSNGEQVRDYIHVDDVVSMINLVLQKPEAENEIFNVCTGTLTSVKDIISYAEEFVGSKLNYEFKVSNEYWSKFPRLNSGVYSLNKRVIVDEVNKFALGSTKKIESVLEWKPNKNIRELMIKTMEQNYERYSK
jgi:nucleoside-diphosphate-sugar epimerase